MMMVNHGVLVAAPTVAEAFDQMYFLERACQTLVLALSTGKPLRVMSDEVAERTAQDWEHYAPMQFAHFEEMKRLLEREEPDYAS
jgi:ribulose-5-phosphate 4-epimerase/fuculose-1-phosphate aldolase